MTSWPDNILKQQRSLFNQQSLISKTSNARSNTSKSGNQSSSIDSQKWADLMKQQLIVATNAKKSLNENIIKTKDDIAFQKYYDAIKAQQNKDVNNFKNQAQAEAQYMIMNKDAKNTVVDSQKVSLIGTAVKDNEPAISTSNNDVQEQNVDNTNKKQQQMTIDKKQMYPISDASLNNLQLDGNIDSWISQAIEQTGVGNDWAPAIKWIMNKESNGNPNAQNPNSSAYGLMQLKDETWKLCGFTKTSDPVMQVIAGIEYIKKCYGTADNAKAFWQQNHWY